MKVIQKMNNRLLKFIQIGSKNIPRVHLLRDTFFSNVKNSLNKKVAILTPFDSSKYDNASQIFPYLRYAPARKWEYYHHCLNYLFHVKYFNIETTNIADIKNFDYVFVHETLYNNLANETIEILTKLKKNNLKIIWVELHERSIYSPAVFLDGFFDNVDILLKHQLLNFTFLKNQLNSLSNSTLAPYKLFGCKNLIEYFSNERFFSFGYSPKLVDQVIENHIDFNFESFRLKIKPIMFPFSSQYINRVRFNNLHKTYIDQKNKTYFISYAGRGSNNPAHAQRYAIFEALKRILGEERVISVPDYRRSIENAQYFLALGHIHSSLRTFDNLIMNTGLIHYDIYPYKTFLPFEEFVNYVPIGNPHCIFPEGNLEIDTHYFNQKINTMIGYFESQDFKDNLIRNQKVLLEKIIDPYFIVEQLGINKDDIPKINL